jgi:hypothetical protein
MENGGNRIDKKQSLLVKFKIIVYVDQILSSSKREREDLRSEHKKRTKNKKNEQTCLALSVNDEDERKTRDSPETQA